MLHLKTKKELSEFLGNYDSSYRIGLVPTMGVIHQGHLSLIDQSKKDNDLTICSIFVNPLQFNRKTDLKNYPNTIDKDIELLTIANCDVIFTPSAKEMYPDDVKERYDFGKLENTMEGKHRPGHFNGVAVVINRFLNLVKPHKAYFGQKDIQQLAIIKVLAKKHHPTVEIIGCPIVREKSGLAMSSRNALLTENQKKTAAKIYQWLNCVIKSKDHFEVKENLKIIKNEIRNHSEMKLEYLEIVDAKRLQPILDWKNSSQKACCIAIYLGEIRLIDNVLF